jgi:hypothetical protein
MKTYNSLAAMKMATITATLLAVSSGAALAQGNSGNSNGNSNSNANKIPAAPVGWLNAYPTVVQTGTKPQLSWSTTYPSQVLNYVEIIQPSTIKLKKALDVEVRILGNGVTSSSSNSNTFSWIDAEAQLSYNNGSYGRIFYGKNTNVNPSSIVWSRTVAQTAANDTLRFGGRYYFNKAWGPTYTSNGSTTNIRTLINGDAPPTYTPMYQAPSLEEFIKPYLDGNGKVKIGPMDVIVFMELTHTSSQQTNPGYDLQDMVLIVTFKDNKPKNNNGHGNNADGIDSSNPGNAPFMKYDSDPNVDDEN